MKNKDKQLRPEFGDHESGLLLWQVSGLWEKSMKTTLKKQGLTYLQYVLASRLYELESSMKNVTQIKLAEYANTEPMLTSKALRGLEEQGFLRRIKDDKDTRANIITLTDKGKKKVSKVSEIVRSEETNFFSTLDSKVNHFSKSLQKLFEQNLG